MEVDNKLDADKFMLVGELHPRLYDLDISQTWLVSIKLNQDVRFLMKPYPLPLP